MNHYLKRARTLLDVSRITSGKFRLALAPCDLGHIVREIATTFEEAARPTQRDRHLQCIAETSRMAWQKASDYNKRARVEAAIGRWKQALGEGPRSRIDERRVTEINVAVDVLNRMLDLGRPNYVRIV